MTRRTNITTNFLYNVVLTLSTYVINFILFPYVSRVLGVGNLGRIGFVTETVNYFIIFAMMGISTVGIREIAACREDPEKRSRVFSSLMTILAVSTGVVLLVYWIVIGTVDRFAGDRLLFFVGSALLLFSSFMIEWLYQGMENFRYVTLRSLLVKLLYALLVFLTVRTPEDYKRYFYLTVGCVVVNALVNLAYSRNFVHFSFREVRLRDYWKPFFSLGAYKLTVSMYTTFNVVFLGFVCSDSEVGCYYASNKLFYLILGLFTAFTSVMLPRMSSLLAEHEEDEFHRLTSLSFELVFALAFPLICYCMCLTPQIIRLMSGAGYEGAVLPMRIITPVLLLSGLAQVWVIQVLLPLRKDRVVLVSSLFGATAGILLNILLVKRLGAVGSALVLLCSELAGNTYSFIYAQRKGYISFPFRALLISLLGALPYLLCCWIGIRCVHSVVGELALSAVLCALYFYLFNGILYRESAVSEYLRHPSALFER